MKTCDPDVPCGMALSDDIDMSPQVVGSIALTIPTDNTESALARTEVQNGTGLPSMSAVNAGPARAIRLSM